MLFLRDFFLKFLPTLFYNYVAEKMEETKMQHKALTKNECVFNISAKIQMCLEKDMNCILEYSNRRPKQHLEDWRKKKATHKCSNYSVH